MSFDIHLDGLDAATRDAGTATMATQGDNPGATYQAFPLCVGAETPTADGCVLIERLDADGNPTMGTPATVRFSNVAGHFSTWAVAIVEAEEEPTQAQPPSPLPGDSTPPTIVVPDDIVVNARTPDGAVVHFDAIAHDDVDGDSPADCDPASGSIFPATDDGLGTLTTTVTCSKTDAAGNAATPESFTVTVRGVVDQLVALKKRIADSRVRRELRVDLTTRLRATLRDLRATPPDLQGACRTLRTFIRNVDGNVGSDRLNRFAAQRWIATARRARTIIGC